MGRNFIVEFARERCAYVPWREMDFGGSVRAQPCAVSGVECGAVPLPALVFPDLVSQNFFVLII